MGRNKAFIRIEGVPLWQRQLSILRQLYPAEIFLAGPPRPEWSGAGCIIISDAREDCGPLGGLVAALRRCSTKFLLVLAVDLPNITFEHLHLLVGLCSEGKGVIPVTEEFEPLVALYPTRSLGSAEELLGSGRYSLQEFAARCIAEELADEHQVALSDAALYLNMNTPTDLADLAHG